ncbi:Cyclin-L1-1 [Olea europaea subsp. europaea]|uniref:Cyclin-L1-1 n=1 Tax=Olea europaea subsp. europaea TaxID=158383 RepID=A0A8S0VGU4_OLEEU|nr:Cyclin-L1-1 [Olea europaea subsp. europaea]
MGGDKRLKVSLGTSCVAVISTPSSPNLEDKELQNLPSRRDGIDEAKETTLRIYGCDLIQESGILLKLRQAVMATSLVLFHRFYCKKSFARFNVKRVVVSCVWLASKLEEKS